MTATYIQVLRAGPVQPIGLPPTAMGVTNARVLHRRMINNNSETINNNNTLLSAKRCLFGSPAPGEIQSLYKEEQKQNRERFIQRYNYDILNDRFVNDDAASVTIATTAKIINNIDSAVDSTQHQQQQQQDNTENCNTHETLEDRLHDDKSNVDTTDASSGCSSNCDIKCNLDTVQLLAISNDNNNTKTTSTTDINQSLKDRKPNERLKPYSRQILMTGCSIIHWLNTDGKMFIPKLQKRLLQYPQSASINHKNNNNIINNNIRSTNNNTNINNACNRSESITEATESQASQSTQVPTL